MKFKEALELMKQGHKLKLPSWSGYWTWDAEKKTILMHSRPKDSDTGNPVIDIRETQRVEYTLGNIISDEWCLATEENCTLLGGTPTFAFGDAIKYLKRGLKVKRKGWNGKDQYIVYVDPSYNRFYEVIEKEDMPGTLYPYIAMKTNDNTFVPWLASQTDMINEDWTFAE